MRRFGHSLSFGTDQGYIGHAVIETKVTSQGLRAAADRDTMRSTHLFEVGQTVLVAAAPDDPPWRMTVDLVQDDEHVTLATVDDEHLPAEWRDLREVHITSIDRFSVHLIHAPVMRSGDTRLVIGDPHPDTGVQRRAYARVFSPVPATCMLLRVSENQWINFEAEVRDLGGGGCSFVSDVFAEDGASVVTSFSLDDHCPIVIVGRVLPREELPTIGKLMTRVEFVLIRESDRDRILGWVLRTLASRRHAGRQLQTS
jgi:PilZ domain-containing protein